MKSHDDLIPLAIDCETDLIGPGAVAPPLICACFVWRDEDGHLQKVLAGNHPDDGLEEKLEKALTSERHLLVFHNGAYDLAVIANKYPRLIPLIFAALDAGRVDDTIPREKLLNLSTHGQLEMMQLPDGSNVKIGYHLTDLESKYFGQDRSAEKAGADVWRLNYRELDGWKAADYPDEAAEYALDDGVGTLRVWEYQEDRVHRGDGQVETSRFQACSAFALYLKTAWGFAVDQAEVLKIERILEKELAPDRLDLLIASGILRKGEPARPHSRHLKKAQELLLTEAFGEGVIAEMEAATGIRPNRACVNENFDWKPHVAALEAHGIKFTAPVEPTRDTKVLKKYIVDLCKEKGRKVKLTDTGIEHSKGERFVDADSPIALEYASSDADFLDQLSVYEDPVLEQYSEREELAKIVGTYMPVLRGADVVHFNFNALVETGRTSSYGAKKGKALYPCTNGQNQPKEVRGCNIRHCFVPRPRRVLWDVDFQALELACVGQITKNLFGQSIHLDRYNEGVDLHAYLGAQLALRLGKDPASRMFQEACQEEGLIGDHMGTYLAFRRCKGQEGDLGEFYKHFRNFAKPVGLGYPGGLGAATMVTFARTTYGVKMTEEDAKAFKQVWLATYPEMVEYFKWVAAQVDELNPATEVDDWGNPKSSLMYVTPLGMLRRGAAFCDVANGMAMQSPGAEGAKMADFNVTRACYDETRGSILFGCKPIVFVHDQIIGETSDCQETWHDECMEVSRIMVESMKTVLPDVKMRTEPLLTTVWSKAAVPVYDENKRLIPWSPE